MMSKLKAALVALLQKPGVQATIVAAVVSVTASFGLHLPGADIAYLVSGAVGLVASLLHVASLPAPVKPADK